MFGVWRMIMKKYIIILLTICLSLSMVACSMNNNVSDSVDLQHPDGPNSTKNSPFSTEKETFFKTGTFVSYDLFISTNSNFFILFIICPSYQLK